MFKHSDKPMQVSAVTSFVTTLSLPSSTGVYWAGGVSDDKTYTFYKV